MKHADDVSLHFAREGRVKEQPSIAAFGVMDDHVLGDGKYAGSPLELNPIRGIRSELNLARFCAKPRDDIANRTASTKLRQQESSVGRVVPYPELVRGAP